MHLTYEHSTSAYHVVMECVSNSEVWIATRVESVSTFPNLKGENRARNVLVNHSKVYRKCSLVVMGYARMMYVMLIMYITFCQGGEVRPSHQKIWEHNYPSFIEIKAQMLTLDGSAA